MIPAASRVLFRARVVLPVTRPPIENGAVLVVGRQLTAVGSWNSLRSSAVDQVRDLGESILLPGLVNAHCHLDYTDMAGQVTPTRSFSDWIKAVLALKAHRAYSEYALSWIRGAHMLLKHGVTTVADIEAVPELLPEVLSTTPLRVCSLLELTGVRSRRPAAEILHSAVASIEALPEAIRWAGLSPHAPYSTTPELLQLSAVVARQRQWLLATHVAESLEEFDMFQAGRGRMFDWLDGQRDMSDCRQGSPVQHLHRHGILGPQTLAVHANYLAPGDAELFGRTQTSVVHCPRSHAYFGHRPFPRAELTAAGVNLCLGTDSLASVKALPRRAPELNLFAEMRVLSDRDPQLDPKSIVRFATVNGATALGMRGKLGELAPGAWADLITVPFTAGIEGVYEALVHFPGAVSGVMINGRWALAHPMGEREGARRAGERPSLTPL